MKKVTIQFNDVESHMDFHTEKPEEVFTVHYVINVEHDNGHTEYAGSARVGEEVVLDNEIISNE